MIERLKWGPCETGKLHPLCYDYLAMARKYANFLIIVTLLMGFNAFGAWQPKKKIDRQRFISDQTKQKILLEHFKEGEKTKQACLECHDAPPSLQISIPKDEVHFPKKEITATADHRRFAILKGPFRSGPEVTATCLTCHTEAAKQVMKTSHWTWLCPKSLKIGKGKHVVNNFCIALASNEPRCTSCHAGYGWKDQDFDFSSEMNVDCLVCHDTTGTYRKFPTDAGHPNYISKEWPKNSGNVWQPVDLAHIAQNIGKPSRQTCGACHFWGGGGEGVKHGDMDATLENPTKDIDVHMNSKGLNFSCVDCHTTHQHKISGRCFTIPGVEDPKFKILKKDSERNFLACQSCHTDKPHEDSLLNRHMARIACQTCHVPTFARERPTKMWWDWSKAGKKDEKGNAITQKSRLQDGTEVITYSSKKGEFLWAKNIAPEYRWFNGKVDQIFLGDVLDTKKPGSESLPYDYDPYMGQYNRLDFSQPVVQINSLNGSYEDSNARIWPFKIHRGKQPYDPANQTLVVPKLFGKKGSGAYWADFDWETSIKKGMAAANQPYSGTFSFIQTEMHWPLSHMVAPKEQALSCESCHSKKGRLAHLQGFYLLGRDSGNLLDGFGLFLMIGTLLAASIHALLRLFSRKQGQHRGTDQ